MNREDEIKEKVMAILKEGILFMAEKRKEAYQLLRQIYDEEQAAEELEILEDVVKMGLAIEELAEVIKEERDEIVPY